MKSYFRRHNKDALYGMLPSNRAGLESILCADPSLCPGPGLSVRLFDLFDLEIREARDESSV